MAERMGLQTTGVSGRARTGVDGKADAQLGKRLARGIDAALRRSPMQPVFAWRASRRLAVLAYHQIDDPEGFTGHVEFVRKHLHPVSLEEVVRSTRSGRRLPYGSVLFTFDDGHRSVLEIGMPILRERGIPGVAFLVAGLLDGEEPFWWDEVERLVALGAVAPSLEASTDGYVRRLKAVPDARRLTVIRELRASVQGPELSTPQLRRSELPALVQGGIVIGNHTLTHPILSACPDEKVVNEVAGAHRILHQATGEGPTAFAYPDGTLDPRAARRLRELGYSAAFLFDHRLASMPIDEPLAISRLRVNATTSFDRFRVIVSGLHPAIHRLRGRR